jgi:hypothetical protein
MEIRSNGTRFNNYDNWEIVKYAPYDYTKKGLLNHIMSSSIVNTNNGLLHNLLQFVESSLIFAMKYTDMLKHFKNSRWKNR